MTALTLRPRICDDLVPLILEQNDSRWWPCDFQRLALVSPAWLAPVRKRLYAFPTVRTFRACTLLARTLQENPHLLGLLEGIDLRPLSDAATASSARYGVSPHDMASLRFLLSAQCTPKLVLAGDLAIKAERFLQAIATPHSIVELHIDGNTVRADEDEGFYGGSKTASLRWDHALASAFPKLQRLRLCNLDLEIPRATAATPGNPQTFRPQDLVLDNVSVEGNLLHLADLSGLRRLSVSCQCPVEFGVYMHDVLTACAGSLETLHYEAQDAHNDASVLLENLDVAFPALTELSLSGIRCDAQALMSVSQRCQRLRTLAVCGRTVPISASDWAALVRSGAFAALRELMVPQGVYQAPFMRWTSAMTECIVSACRAQGIQVTF